MDQRPTIHVVEDDNAVRDSMALLLEVEGFVAHTYASGAAFFRDAHLDGNYCIIVDMHMPGMSGIELLNLLRRDGTEFPAIIMTAMADGSIRRAVERINAVLLEKPFHPGAVVHSIETVL